MPSIAYYRNYGKTFKKPRRPFEKERLDAELKVRGGGATRGEGRLALAAGRLSWAQMPRGAWDGSQRPQLRQHNGWCERLGAGSAAALLPGTAQPIVAAVLGGGGATAIAASQQHRQAHGCCGAAAAAGVAHCSPSHAGASCCGPPASTSAAGAPALEGGSMGCTAQQPATDAQQHEAIGARHAVSRCLRCRLTWPARPPVPARCARRLWASLACATSASCGACRWCCPSCVPVPVTC